MGFDRNMGLRFEWNRFRVLGFGFNWDLKWDQGLGCVNGCGFRVWFVKMGFEMGLGFAWA